MMQPGVDILAVPNCVGGVTAEAATVLQYLGTPTTADPLTEIIQREDNKVVRRTVLALWRWTVFTAFANIVGVGVYSIMRQRIGDC